MAALILEVRNCIGRCDRVKVGLRAIRVTDPMGNEPEIGVGSRANSLIWRLLNNLNFREGII